MSKVKVKTESKAKRCEICHKSDEFDPNKNICFRCNKYYLDLTNNEEIEYNYNTNEESEVEKENEERFNSLESIIKRLAYVCFCTIIGLYIGAIIAGILTMVFGITNSFYPCIIIGILYRFIFSMIKSTKNNNLN